MKYLAIDTAGNNLTVAVKGEKTAVRFDPDCKIKHSVALMPAVESCLEEANVSLDDLDFIACVTGAGSFTGIRIGVSTAKALCFCSGKPCLNITTFDTIAYNKKNGKVLAVIDAGHGGYYVAGYDDGKVSILPSYINAEKLSQLQQEYSLLSGEPIKNVETQTVSVLDGLFLAIEAKTEEVTDDIEKLTPLYIRKSQAEEGR